MSSIGLMLSKLLQHARNILPAQSIPHAEESNREGSLLPATMVTTRQSRGRNSDAGPGTSLASESLPSDVPSSGSKKRRRAQVTGDLASHTIQSNSVSTTSTRKRQKLPLREKDEPQFERHTHIAVEIPVKEIMQEDTPMWTVSEQTKSEKDALSTEDNPSILGAQEENNSIGTRKGEDCDPGLTEEEAVEETVSISGVFEKIASKQARKTKPESKSERNPKSAPERNKTANSSETKQPTHKRFGSEEPEIEDVEQKGEAKAETEEDASSDDDAPELVAKGDAQEEAVVTARSAAKAIEQQDAALHKKRRDRDEQLKKQAEAPNKKRKHTDNSDGGQATFTPLLDTPNAFSGKLKSSKPGNTKTKTKIPEFLPLEFLEDEDASDSGAVSLTEQTMVHKSKRTKFLDSTAGKPKDRRKGSTIYRVLEAYGDGLLAPKAAKNARSVKEAWLNGQRGSGGIKKVVRGGFFKK